MLSLNQKCKVHNIYYRDEWVQLQKEEIESHHNLQELLLYTAQSVRLEDHHGECLRDSSDVDC